MELPGRSERGGAQTEETDGCTVGRRAEGGVQITVVAPKGSRQKKKTMQLLRCLTYSDVLHFHFLNTWFLFSVSYKLSLLFLSVLCVT